MDLDTEITRTNKRLAALEAEIKGIAPEPADPKQQNDLTAAIRALEQRVAALEQTTPGDTNNRIVALESFRHRIEALAGAAPAEQPAPPAPPPAA